MINIALLDADTLAPNIQIPSIRTEHHLETFKSTSPENVRPHARDAEIILTNKVGLHESDLQRLPKLRYIGILATGYNNVDLDACRRLNIKVCNVKAYSTEGVAEHVFTLMLNIFKRVKAYQQSLEAGAWQASGQFVYFDGEIKNVSGKILGLVGTGSIARRVAELARAFGMKVVWYSPSGRDTVDGEACTDLDGLLAQSDIVSIHCPLTPTTEALIDASVIKKMKAHACLINTARGPIVDVDAVIEALKEGRLAGAGLDVFPEEPPALDSAIMQNLNVPNLIVTPHTAWASTESQQLLVNKAIESLDKYLAGEVIDNLAE